MPAPVLVPKLWTTLRGYTRGQLVRDSTAGVTVGVVALPLAIAFAIASGLTPQAGLYTAVVAGFVISALGGSRVQIGGPTGAFVVIVYGIVHTHGVDGLLVATLMAGGILVALGLSGMGAAIRYIPHAVTIGFTSSIALIIAIQNLDTALGLTTGPLPAHAVERAVAYVHAAGTADPYAIAVSAATLVILVGWPRLAPRIPAPFVALIAVTAAVTLLDLPVTTVGAKFGEIAAGFPEPRLPGVSLGVARDLVGPALAIAALGAIESLLSATVADGMIGGRHRPNMELVAQGVANIASPLFGGLPATGAIARTATNVRSGGRTPVAGIVHAATVLLVTLFFGRWAALIPMPALAAILLMVAYHMSEWRTFRAELRAPRSDVAVLLATFLLTLLVDLTVGIGVGMVLAAFLFLRRMSEVTGVRFLTPDAVDEEEDAAVLRGVPEGVRVYAVDGPFFFGAAEKFRETIGSLGERPKALVLRLRDVPAIDSTGMHALRELIHRAQRERTLVVLAELQAQPLAAVRRAGLLDEVGAGNVAPSLDVALAIATHYVQHRRPTPAATLPPVEPKLPAR